jgi:hypothetical protein
VNRGEKLVDNSYARTQQCVMTGEVKSRWIDPDDAPELTPELAKRAQISIGGKVLRRPRETLHREGGKAGDAA